MDVVRTIRHDLENARPFGEEILQLYLHALHARRQYADVTAFVSLNQNLRIVYDLLDVWDQHVGRSKRIDYDLFYASVDRNLWLADELLEGYTAAPLDAPPSVFESFCDDVRHCARGLVALEVATSRSEETLRRTAGKLYADLPLMRSTKHIISNAMLLHLLFPDHLMPMDGAHTLNYLYGRDTVLPAARYIEIIAFQQEILAVDFRWRRYLDQGWNTTPVKLVDNAIIFLHRKQMLQERLGW